MSSYIEYLRFQGKLNCLIRAHLIIMMKMFKNDFGKATTVFCIILEVIFKPVES